MHKLCHLQYLRVGGRKVDTFAFINNNGLLVRLHEGFRTRLRGVQENNRLEPLLTVLVGGGSGRLLLLEVCVGGRLLLLDVIGLVGCTEGCDGLRRWDVE